MNSHPGHIKSIDAAVADEEMCLHSAKLHFASHPCNLNDAPALIDRINASDLILPSIFKNGGSIYILGMYL
jgi:hypothetical protein